MKKIEERGATANGATKATVNSANGQPETVTDETKATVNGQPTPATETQKTDKAETVPTLKVETIEELKKRLDAELNRLNEKRKLAAHREKFINSIESLNFYIDELQNETEFETQSGKLTFSILTADRNDRPNFNDTFSISNTALIKAFCKMLLTEMGQKVTLLETQLLTA